MWSGNEVPDFRDDTGLMDRRWAVCEFEIPVPAADVDVELGRNMTRELPLVMVKCNRAYRSMLCTYGHSGVWNTLPEEFRRGRERPRRPVSANVPLGE